MNVKKEKFEKQKYSSTNFVLNDVFYLDLRGETIQLESDGIIISDNFF